MKPIATCVLHRQFQCPILKCDDLEPRVTRPLFAVMFEYFDKTGKLIADDEYIHAESEGEARLTFWAGQPLTRRINNVLIAPVVGYLVLDNHGDKLSV